MQFNTRNLLSNCSDQDYFQPGGKNRVIDRWIEIENSRFCYSGEETNKAYLFKTSKAPLNWNNSANDKLFKPFVS